MSLRLEPFRLDVHRADGSTWLTGRPGLPPLGRSFNDYAGDVFEGIATGYGYVTGLAHPQQP